MEKITRIVAIVLVVLAFVLALLAFSLGRHRAPAPTAPVMNANTPQPASAQTQGVPVVVSVDPLRAGQVIPASALRIQRVAQAPPDTFGNTDAVAGRMPLVSIPADTPVTGELLAHGVALQLLPGERALAVPVDEDAGVSGRVNPGDYVDVFVSLKRPQDMAASPANARDRSQTRLLLSRLRVLAFGARDLPNPAGYNAPRSTSDANANRATDTSARTAVLAVPVADADQLLLAAQNGKLTLALRFPGDESTADASLFPTPAHVLQALPTLDSNARAQAGNAENSAYAGIDGSGLNGQEAARPAARQPLQLSSGLEIIRGTPTSDSRSHQP